MTRRGKIIAGLLLLGLGGAGFWQLRASTPPPATPVPVAASGPIGVGALGRVEPASRIRRLNQPGGMAATRLDRLLVSEGAEVTAGQLLAEFADAAMKDAAAAQAEAALAEAEAQLARLRAAGRPSEIEAQRARVAAIAPGRGACRRRTRGSGQGACGCRIGPGAGADCGHGLADFCPSR